MNRPRIARWLRITWTAFWGIAAVLLVVLWVRSYWYVDTWYSKHIGVASFCGRLDISIYAQANSDWQGTSLRIKGDVMPLVEAWKSKWMLFDTTVPGSLVSTTPQWLAASVLVLISAAPWIFQRFSLRTLLIAITLVAVVLGIIVVLYR